MPPLDIADKVFGGIAARFAAPVQPPGDPVSASPNPRFRETLRAPTKTA
jgi:hypothetical protein